MKSDGKSSEGHSGDVPSEEGPVRLCPVCHVPLMARGSGEFCPICMLREGLEVDVETESITGSVSLSPEHGFEHYELALTPEGRPVELGRGAMGITYKAFDLELRCPVALKVIGERYVGDEGARRRFLREARAAASVRHPNVASVFHLGRTGGNYFYAMEFVEGETLQRLIKRSGRVEVRQALEIISQVAAGLAAVHKQNLVHRDIKPANIMVSLEERGAGMIKIIDLGLAKAFNESFAETAISIPGAFAGTPEFASPEQILGLGVDIRSDLYSLGVTLWEMVTGQVPFRGAPAEVLYQHQHKPLPTTQLNGVSQPIVALLEVLLKKDPAHRFQTPNELLETLATMKGSVLTGRRLMKTVRVHVSSSADVQKERNLAERLIHSIAAEFDLPVSAPDLHFRRLVEANSVLQHDESMTDQTELGNFVLCPYFSQNEKRQTDIDQEIPASAAEFDLTICIVWSRLGPLAGSNVKQLEGVTIGREDGSDAGPAFHGSILNQSGRRLSVYRNCSNPTPPLEPKEEREEFGRRWDELQEFFATWENESGTNLYGTVHHYRSLEEFEELFRASFRRFLAGWFGEAAGQTISRRRARRWKSSPFRGLNVFGFEHSPIFHGRTKAIGEVLEAMEAQVRAERPFVMVVGASGSGKSSLVQAGVLPLLAQPGTIEGIELWRRAVTRPGAGGGGDCFDALAAALLESAGLPTLRDPESVSGTEDLARELRDHSDSVALRVRDALDHAAREWKINHRHKLEQQEQQFRASGRAEDADLLRQRCEKIGLPKARLALVVDQLEELFTAGFSPTIRQNYVSAIAGLVRSGRVFVLVTLRSDFYPSYQQFPELIELTKPGGKVDLRAPTSYEIGEMIRLPAEAAGLYFEEEPGSGQHLDEALRDAASATPESLPLLEHVLSLLYDEQARRGDNLLRWSDYRELGELKGALAKHAERVFETLRPEEQNAVPLVLRYLVTLNQGEEDVPNRRTVPYRDFIVGEGNTDDQKFGAKGFVDLFIQKRLLVADTDPRGDITVSVAHEALLREWQRVREWLSENREFLRMRDRLDSSLKLWLSRGRQKDDLLRPGLALAEGEKLAADFGSSLSEEQADYIRASVAERSRLKSVEERTRFTVMAGITVALVVAIVFAVISFRQYRRAEKAKNSANRAAESARHARMQAEDLINFMTVDLRDKLRPIGQMDPLEAVSGRVKSYYEGLAHPEYGPETRRNQSIARVNDADLHKAGGNLNDAFDIYTEALATQRTLAGQDPKDVKLKQDLCSTLEKIGDVLIAQGNVPLAREKFQEALKIRQSLIDAFQLELSLSYADIGDILSIQGDSTDALEYCRKALAIREALLQRQPEDTGLKRYRFTCLGQIGHEQLVQGELAEASKTFRQSLDITSKLAGVHPQTPTSPHSENALWRRDYSISLERMGDVYAAQGNWAEALQVYQSSHEIRLDLQKSDPKNADCQSDVLWTYLDIGDVQMAQGDLEATVKSYGEAFSIADGLAKKDAANNEWQSNLATVLEKQGEAQSKQGKLDDALNNFQESLDITKRLTERDPTNNEWQASRAIITRKIAETLASKGNLQGALEGFRDSLAICKKLVQLNSKNVQWATGEALACSGIGVTLRRMGSQGAEIRAMLTHAQEIFIGLQRRSALDARNENLLKEIQSALDGI
jgi:serine/threonine protein kinase/tetratricopeptide (TPR) repeat protein